MEAYSTAGSTALTAAQLTGRVRTHIASLSDPPAELHPAAVPALQALRAAAQAAGIDLRPVSTFRDFERQCAIWNAKYQGQRPVLDRAGAPIDPLALAPAQRAQAILLWSALPGASRHHWGSDLDVIDGSATEAGYRPALSAAEFAPGGPYARLDRWLAEHAEGFGFFRPYDRDRGGVAPEPWHLSYAPVAIPALAALSHAVLADALATAPLEGKEAVLAMLPALHERYVQRVAPGAAALAAAPLSRAARPS